MGFNLIAIADLHLKFHNNVDREWQESRYKLFIDDLVERCVSTGAILAIAGDSLDSTHPKKEELRLFMYMLHELNAANVTTLLVSGNHEGLGVNKSILDYLEVSKFPNVAYRTNYTTIEGGVTFHLVNHDSLTTYNPDTSMNKYNVLVSHFRCNVNKYITEEIDVKEFCRPYDLCIVGDIHEPLQIDKVWYCNAPVNKDFEANPKCGLLKVQFEGGKFYASREELNYPSLVSITTTAEKFAKKRTNGSGDFYRIEVTGTPEELRSLKSAIPNTVVCKVPVVKGDVGDVVEAPETIESESLTDGLINYMKSLDMSDYLISGMLEELRRSDD